MHRDSNKGMASVFIIIDIGVRETCDRKIEMKKKVDRKSVIMRKAK